MKQIVLATRNSHKIDELQFFLNGLPLEVLTLNDFPEVGPLMEDGSTFAENAVGKARKVFQQTNAAALADDSGLEVFYLNARPGVYSARYAGVGATDEANNAKLLQEMRGVAPRRRTAQFRAVLAFVGKGFEITRGGFCPGRLGEYPRGSNGFGYDPIFIPAGFSKTYAQLTGEEKNRISHRSRAFVNMRSMLLNYL